MTAPPLRPPPTSTVSSALAAGRLGVAHVIFFVWSSATPETVVAGVMTMAFAATGVTGLPLAFLLVGGVLLIFAPGYIAMSRQISNAGAFYSYIARGLGPGLGIGAAWIALLSYNGLQNALYGAVDAAADPLLQQWFGISPQWWVIALCCWALVAVLGVLRVEVNGRVLAVLLLAEVAVITVFSAANLLEPANGHVSFLPLSPAALMAGGFAGLGVALAIGILGSVGFESTVVFSEETKDPKRTIARATYSSIILIAVLYAFASWGMAVGAGPDTIVAASGEQGTDLLFNLAGARLGAWASTLGHVLFFTSVIAALISFHNTVARYMFALGREKVLPAALGRTWSRTMAPRNASLTQSGVALAVIAFYALGGFDPVVQLFYWVGTSGGLGVLLLLFTTSVAVIRYFARTPTDETLWRRVIAPSIAAVLLAGMAYLGFDNIGLLLGVPAGHPLIWVVPAAFGTAVVLGLVYSRYLKIAKPAVYAVIGLGARAVTAPQIPAPRTGAHSAGNIREGANR
jgi:amino acid transporter